MNLISKWPLAAAAVLAPVAFIGCGGSSNSNIPKTVRPTPSAAPTATMTPIDPNIANANFVGLRTGGTSLLTFRGNAASAALTRNVSGLPGGVSLRGIDTRVAPSNNAGSNGVVAVYALGTNDQLYTLNLSGAGDVAATAVGAPATFTGFALGNGAYGFDFNPAADRLRVVSGNQNSRLNPNNGAAVDGDTDTTNGVNPDGTLRYSSGDTNRGTTPNITAAGYTNNTPDTATTINYGIDTNLDILVTQGSPNSRNDDDGNGTPDGAVSPNTGLLFTVGSVGFNLPEDVGLEVFGSSNTAVAVGGNTFYSVNLGSGQFTPVAQLSSTLIDVTVAPQN